ncbi:uncharacterized protein LOC134239787 [Saccostrea cucullata]|uniref:uncharacterized protein LOC134239787 n=1 Tax=Saccostrea cuccullata TaxID=36930 RepID=UPI002ED3414B
MATGVDGKKDLQEDIDESKGKKDLQEIIEQINAEEHYRVITKEEYELLKGQKIPTTPKIEHGLSQGTIPKLPPLGQVPPPNHIPTPGYLHPPGLMSSPQFFNSSALFHQNNNPTPVKLPTFSGSEQAQKGEVSYDVWSYEVRCLKGQWPDHVLLQPVRSSLKGTAREILIPLGEYATVENILAKLEQCISKAVKLGHIDVNAKDPMLRSKLWSGLRSTQLRNATRHKYETVKEFHSLLREIRQIEQEETSLKSVNSVPKSSVAMSSNVDSMTIQNSELQNMQKQLTELLFQMKKLDSRMSKIEQSSNANNQTQTTGFNNTGSFQTSTSNNIYHRGNFKGRRNLPTGAAEECISNHSNLQTSSSRLSNHVNRGSLVNSLVT